VSVWRLQLVWRLRETIAEDDVVWDCEKLLLGMLLFGLEDHDRSMLRITDLYEDWISLEQAGQVCLIQSVRSYWSKHSATDLRFLIALILFSSRLRW
jgi:hypothetical protein